MPLFITQIDCEGTLLSGANAKNRVDFLLRTPINNINAVAAPLAAAC